VTVQDRTASPEVDLVDDTYVACAPDVVAQVVADERRWHVWWPDLHLTTTRDRGPKGRQWAVRGALLGTMEIWLEPWWDGVIPHLYLRADPARLSVRPRRADDDAHAAGWAARERQRRAQQWKRHVHRLKDELEDAREQ
jgi:hypothetical protein